MEFIFMALQALLDPQDPKAGRVLQEMSSLQDQVLLAHLAVLGLWGQAEFKAFLEAQGLQVYKVDLDHQVTKDSQGSLVTLGPRVPWAHPVQNVTCMDLQVLQVFQETLDVGECQATLVRKDLREIQVPLVMDRGVHRVSMAHLVCQDQLDQEAQLAP